MDSTSSHPRIAIIGTGIDTAVLPQSQSGWRISTQQEKLIVEPTNQDSVGGGTEMAQRLSEILPSAILMGIDIFNGQSKTTSTLLLKALEKSIDLNCDAILVCVPSFNEEKRQRFAKVCAYAHKKGIPIVSIGVENRISYPSQVASVFGVISHMDCKEHMYVYDHQFFDEQHPNRGLFVLNGWHEERYVGAEMAAIRLLVMLIELLQTGRPYESLFEAVNIRAFIPFSEFGFV